MTMSKKRSNPAKQGESEVGPGKPPKEHQFQPGQSGNPAGPPKRRTQLWVYINKFMEMTDAQLKRQHGKKLTAAQQIALKLVDYTWSPYRWKSDRDNDAAHRVISEVSKQFRSYEKHT
jgi:hypothetical protein